MFAYVEAYAGICLDLLSKDGIDPTFLAYAGPGRPESVSFWLTRGLRASPPRPRCTRATPRDVCLREALCGQMYYGICFFYK